MTTDQGAEASTSGLRGQSPDHDGTPTPESGAAPQPPLVANHGQVDPGADDLLRAIALVIAAGGDDSDVQSLRMDGPPWSKARPRYTRKGRAYVLPEDRDAQLQTARRLSVMRPEPATGNVALACVFYRPNRQRIDADNLLKHVCDAATGVLWNDDSQATAVLGVIEMDAEHPRTAVAIAPHGSTLGRGTDWTGICRRCGAVFVINPKHIMGKYCGPVCSDLARGHVLAEKVSCANCFQMFRRKTKTQRFCSQACRIDSVRGAPKGTNTNSRCTRCDKVLAHRRGGTCRACWLTRNNDVQTDGGA